MAKAPLGLHPLVQAALDETLRDIPALFHAAGDGEHRRAVGRYSAMQQKRLLLPLASLFLALLSFVFSMAAFEGGQKAVGSALILFCLVTIAYFVSHLRSMRLTMEELAALAPALRLTRVQRAYLDARLALHDLSLPNETKEELGAGLDRLADEEARLIAMRDGWAGSGAQPDALRMERDRLAARLAAEADPVAREALAHGLATCERRLAAAQALSVAEPRIDAQLEMIAQSAEDVRDGLLRLRAAPGDVGTEVGMDGVRQALEHVQSHAAALESAVAEVRALEARG